MSSIPVLTTLDLTKYFVVECDALGFGIGAVFIQEGYTIAFDSRKLNKRESFKSMYDKEMFFILGLLLILSLTT